jgi:hypothetical protein
LNIHWFQHLAVSSFARQAQFLKIYKKAPPPGQRFFAGINGHKNTALPYGGRLMPIQVYLNVILQE